MNKYLILLRGLPGAGKSSFAEFMYPSFLVCEADKYFVDKNTGEYKWDGSKLHEAHEWCYNLVETYMKDNLVNEQYYTEIVVSNTLTTENEVNKYKELGEKYGYIVISLIVENRHGNKSVHNVPEASIEKMRKRFSIKL